MKKTRKKSSGIFIEVKGSDGARSMVDLAEHLARFYEEPGFVVKYFFQYPNKDNDTSLDNLATALAKDARNYLRKENVYESSLDQLEDHHQQASDYINTHYGALQLQGRLPEISGGSLPEQPLPDSRLKIIDENSPVEGYRDDEGLIRYRVHIGFCWKAAFETIKARDSLEKASQDNDAYAAAVSAAAMMLNACRYGLASELRVGYAWREGQAKGGRKSASAKRDAVDEQHQVISELANKLLESGRRQSDAVNALSKRTGLSSRHIRRIIKSKKKEGHVT